MSEQDIDAELEALEKPPTPVKQKKVPLWGRIFKPFYRLSVGQRWVYGIILVGAIYWASYVLNAAFGEKEVVTPDETVLTQAESTSDGSASINFNAQRSSRDTSETFIEQKQAEELAALEAAEEKRQSIAQGVTFADWEELEVSEEGEEKLATQQGAAVMASDAPGESQDVVHLTSDYYYSQQGQSVISKLESRFTSKSEPPKRGKTNWREVQNTGNTAVEPNTVSFGESNIDTAQAKQEVDPFDAKRGLLPGDSIPCFLEQALDSTVSTQVNCNVRTGVLKGARFVLSIEQRDDYLYLTASALVYRNQLGTVQAIAGPGGDLAMSGIRDEVNYHRLYRWSALLLGGAGEGVWEIVRQPRQQVISTNNQTSVTTGQFEDRDIAIAALSRPIALGTQAAIETFNTPPTVKVDQYRLVNVVFTNEFNAPWLPNITL